jgi:hypothetical protein
VEIEKGIGPGGLQRTPTEPGASRMDGISSGKDKK